MRFSQYLVNKLPARCIIGKRLCRKVFKVEDFRTGITQGLCESVVFFLCLGKVRDIVKKEAVHQIGGDVFHFCPRPAQDHAAERANLRSDMYGILIWAAGMTVLGRIRSIYISHKYLLPAFCNRVLPYYITLLQ